VRVSVVVSTYTEKNLDYVRNCVDSLRRQTIQPCEIILVLDNSQNLVQFYTEHMPNGLRIVASDGFGLSRARNVGVKRATGDVVAFIDDDAIADEKWLENLVSDFDDPGVVGVGGRIDPLWEVGFPTWFPEELYWVIGCSYKGLPTRKAVIRNPIGCNMSFRRSVFEKVGYFSTIFGRIGNNLMGHDDTEFGIRATSKLPGTKILYDPEAVVFHRVSKDRITLKYIMKRSYAEGFSKAFLSHSDQAEKSALNTEKNYLRSLFLSTPCLLFQGKAQTGILRVTTLLVATVMVFLGYVVGSRSN